MTHLSVFGPGFKDFDKFFIGFDDQFSRIAKMHDDLTKNIPNYPPYNIRKTGDNTYVIELAVAGFAKQDIEIELADGMSIAGNSSIMTRAQVLDGADNQKFVNYSRL